MSDVWLDPGTHGVKFFDGAASSHVAIAEFFTAQASRYDPLVLVSRRSTYLSVSALLASGRFGPPQAAGRIYFSDVDEALAEIMTGDDVDPERGAKFLLGILSQVRAREPAGTIRLYGEMVDVLCERGNFRAALALEALCPNLFTSEPKLAVLCGYTRAHFVGDDIAHARAIRAEHTHGDCGEGETARGDNRPPQESGKDPLGAWVYVIDDDDSVRRSLGRLIKLSGFNVRTFDSGEALLVEIDMLHPGCLVIDIQLTGMSGLDLIAHVKRTRPAWPLLAMSGSDDEAAQSEALALGVLTFLKKPLDSQVLLDAIASVLAG
jgi:CheY-like chemotaxis protein